MHELLVDGVVEEVVVGGVGHDHGQAVTGEPVDEEGLLHRDLRADEPDGLDAGGADRGRDDVGEVQHGDVDRLLDLRGDLVEGRGAQEEEVGATALDRARGVGQQRADLVPALVVLEVGHLREVDGGEHELRRGEPAESVPHPEVEVAVVDRAALPAHAADESDGLHARKSAIYPDRCTLCAAAWARGLMTSSSMSTWDGRVATQEMASATSSASSGWSTPA